MSGVQLARIRITGDEEMAARLAAMISALPAVDVQSRSAPYPNRRDPGVRVYLDVLVERPAS